MPTSAYYNRVVFIPTTGGTSAFTVRAAAPGARTPADASIPNGTTVSYTAVAYDLTQWECGQGTYTAGVLARTTLRDSSTGAFVNFTYAPTVQLDFLAQDINVVVNPVQGAASSTNKAITRWNGTTGLLLQNSTVVLDDTGNIFLPSNTKLDWGTGNYSLTHSSTNLQASGTFSIQDINFLLSFNAGTPFLGFDSTDFFVYSRATNQYLFQIGSSTQVGVGSALLFPGSNDGAALGTGLFSWSDLFLASGGVINFANSDYTITHSASTLTLGGATSQNTVINSNTFLDSSIAFRGDISPAAIGADQNDYNPANLATASTLRLASSGSFNITGLAGGADGRIIIVHNVGANAIVLKDEGAGSSAPNRFALTADVTLNADSMATLQYDATSARWRCVSAGSGDVAGPAASIDNEIALYSGVSGKLIKRATGTGWVKATSGVYSTVASIVIADVTNLQTTLDAKQPLDADLTALAAFTGTGVTGWTFRSAADTWGTAGTGTSLRFGAGGVLDAKGFAQPGGRVTLQTLTPVMTTTQSAKTTIYWTPYLHQHAPIYDGTDVVMVNMGGELSQTTADATKSPAAVTTNSNYDLFLWVDAGTARCTRGPPWTSDTARGAGAGTTELTRIQGTLVNANAITNGPAANRGTFVATVRSNGSSQIDWIFGALAANGTAGLLGVWNMYNRIDVDTFVQDSTDSWVYGTTTVRAANASNTMRVSFIQGLAEDGFAATYSVSTSSNVSNTVIGRSAGIGYDSTSAIASGCTPGYAQMAAYQGADGVSSVVPITPHVAHFAKPNDLGFHFVQATEYADAGGTTTWFGDGGGPTILQSGLFFRGRF